MRLSALDQTLVESVMHANLTSFSEPKRHRALRAAFQHFIREVPWAARLTLTLPLAKGRNSIDPTQYLGDVSEAQFVEAEIGADPVDKVEYHFVQRRFAQGRTPTGRPGLLAFRNNNYILFDKFADQAYDVLVTVSGRLISFEPGTATDPDINVSEEYAPDIAWWGGRYYLTEGIKAHDNESSAALEQFNKMIQNAHARGPRKPGQRNSQHTSQPLRRPRMAAAESE